MSKTQPQNAERHSPLTQPIESDVEVERAADGVTLKVPPLGVWRGSKMLFVMGLLWTGMVGCMVLMMLIKFIEGQNDLWPALLLLGLVFLPIGIGLLLAAVNMGRRRAVLAVVGAQLLAMQTGIFGGKRGQWQRREIAQIRIGPSGMEVNEVPVMELQIHPKSGKEFGLLAGRGVKELEWLAAVLKHELQTSAPPGNGDKEEADSQSDQRSAEQTPLADERRGEEPA